MLRPETRILFLALNNIHFLLVLGKSLRNNAPPTILSNTPSWYFLQYHQRYSLQYASHANHVSILSALPTLVLYPYQSRWHVPLARRPHNPRQHFTNIGTSLTLARHRRKHTTHVSMPPTQARHPWHSRQHKQHAISQTPGYPIKLLKFLGLKFQDEIQHLLLLIFIFTAFTFQAFLSIFIEVWKTTIEKLNFLRGNQSALFKRRLFFQKQMRNFFGKKCFPIVS